jgi:hypothetical protein
VLRRTTIARPLLDDLTEPAPQRAESLETTAARVTHHEARAAARTAHYRLMLITDSALVTRSAETLMEATLAIMDAPDRESLQRSIESTRAASRAFVDSARPEVNMLADANSNAS